MANAKNSTLASSRLSILMPAKIDTKSLFLMEETSLLFNSASITWGKITGFTAKNITSAFVATSALSV